MSSCLDRIMVLSRKLLTLLFQFTETVGVLKTQGEITCCKHVFITLVKNSIKYMKHIFFQILSLHETIALPSWYLINLTQSSPCTKIVLNSIKWYSRIHILIYRFHKRCMFFLLIKAYICERAGVTPKECLREILLSFFSFFSSPLRSL